jgi:putative pantetheine hydrolase
VVITEVPGVLVGHAQRSGGGWATGVTAVVPPPGTVGGVDVRGGGPGTHETDALAPGTLVDTVDAVALTGGSAYGLVAAHGVQRWCEEQGRGFVVGARDDGRPVVVPIVPAACVFDLGRGGDWDARPDAEMGYAAAASASSGGVARGAVGAGTGARTQRGAAPGGVGHGLVRLPGGVLVAALAVVNAGGRVVGTPPAAVPGDAGLNTTLAVVVTNATLDVATATRTASAGHDGLARAIDPVHTLGDGDTVFCLATGDLDPSHAAPDDVPGWPGAARVAGVSAVQAAAAEAVRLAVVDAVR